MQNNSKKMFGYYLRTDKG